MMLLSRSYSLDDQQQFAQFSGDYNPMHLDPVAARRTLMGEPVVHGVHLALSALEALYRMKKRKMLSGLKAQFLKPVMLGDIVEFSVLENDERCQISAQVASERVLELTVQFSSADTPLVDRALPPLAKETLHAPAFSELNGQQGDLALGLDSPLAKRLFPHLFVCIGAVNIAEALALTRLVGMVCPGLHSLFSRLDVRYGGQGKSDVLHYSVEKTDERFSLVEMNVKGASLSGTVLAFFRPPPQPQPGMAEIAKLVKSRSFSKSVALIIGGTRGLGETTAKIIAAGGGLPVITYYRGERDAQRVAEEIRAAGGRCQLLQLDVRGDLSVLAPVFKGDAPVRSLYYFATPKIFGRRQALADFTDYYVTAFGRLLDTALEHGQSGLRVLYPSSVAVEEGLRDMAEYAAAKRSGEELCASYNYDDRLQIIVERLPRIHTDQTMTLTGFPAESSVDVMLPLVTRVEKA